MKKLCVLLAVCLLLSSFSALTVYSATSDFDVQNGVLVKYNGTEKNVTIPDSVTAIGSSAFEGNTSLQSVTLKSSVYSVGDRAFYGCTALQSVNGGENVAEVGDLAFRQTPYLEKSTDKYFILGHALLWYNGTSESVTIPSRCTSVSAYAFMKCGYLKSFTAYEGLSTIGSGAFYGCSALTSVNLPSSVSSVGAYAFEGTPYLTNLGEFATVGDGVLVKYQGAATEVEIPDGIRRIAPYAFISSKLVKVSFPDSVYAIDNNAFADNVGLKEIALNEGLVTIGDNAFRGCKALTVLKTPHTLSYIGQYAFRGAALNSASLCGEYLTVSYHAFDGCGSLRYVLMSRDVAAVYDNAFNGCSSLEGVSVPSDLDEIAAGAFSNCPKLTVYCEKNSRAADLLSAYKMNHMMGDADTDDFLSVIDATAIQCFVGEIMELDGTQSACSDVDFDGEITILDALTIQLQVAELI